MSGKPASPMTTLSVVSTLAPSSNPTAVYSPSSSPPSFLGSLLSPSLRQIVSLLSHQLHRLFVPESSWLVSLLLGLYLLRKLLSFSSRSHSALRLPLPIDHHIFPQYIVNKDSLWLFSQHWPIAAPRAYIFISPAYREHSLRYESIARALNEYGTRRIHSQRTETDSRTVQTVDTALTEPVLLLSVLRCGRVLSGFSVYSLDHQGHGQSQGDRGFVWQFDDYVEDYLLFVEHVRANLEPRPCFLLGRGMGATIAIQVMRAFVDIEEERKREAASRVASRKTSPEAASRQLRSASSQPSASAPLSASASSPSSISPSASLTATANLSGLSLQRPSSPRDVDDSDARAALWHWHGCVLISPAIIPPASVSPLQEMCAHLFCDLLPKLGGSVFSFSVLDDTALSRIPSVVAQWQADPLVFKTPMLARWAVETLQTMNELREDSHTITFPFLICQGTDDRFVSPAGADWLYRRSQSRDKKLRKYRGARHDLLHDLNRDTVFGDILRWCDERV